MAEVRASATRSLNAQGEILASMTRQKLDTGSPISLVLNELFHGKDVHLGIVKEYRDQHNFHLTTEDGGELLVPWSKIHHVESRAD